MADIRIGPNVVGGLSGVLDELGIPTGAGFSVVRNTDNQIKISDGTSSFIIEGTGLVTTFDGLVPTGTAGDVEEIRVTNAGGNVVRLINPGWTWVELSTALAEEVANPASTAFDRLFLALTFNYYGNDNADILPANIVNADGPVALNGNDKFFLYGGNDSFFMGGGNDSAIGGDGRDSLFGGDGNDRISGGTKADLLGGGQGNDVLNGGNGGDVILGGGDHDTLTGSFGADALFGEAGNDTLTGGGQNDTIAGGLGDDRMSGGKGADKFDFTEVDVDGLGLTGGGDVITDFKVGVDTLVFNDSADWSITSATDADLVLARTSGGGTITLQGVITGSLTVSDLI